MEQQQKLLWTILSVAILVLVLLGAGMFFFLPADSTGIAKGGNAATTAEWSKSTAPAQISADKEQPKTASEIKEVKNEESAKTEIAESTKTTEINTPVQTEKKNIAIESKPVPVPNPAPVPAKTEIKKSEPVKTEVKEATKTETTNKPSKQSYWIQVGSFSSMDTAEKTKGQLSANGYKSTIQTISSNGKTFHRVKLGPYATKADIDSLLPKIKALDGMSESFMTTK